MRKGITSLIDSIVEKNPYDYSLWENIFTVKSESEVFERALEFFPTSPIVWRRYIEYLQSQKSTDERVLLGIYQRCVQQCSCVMIWKLFVQFVEERIHSLKERYQIYQLALDTIGSDPRSGFVWQRMYKLRLLVYNTLISKNVPSLSGNTLLLNPFETSTIPIISEQVEECFALGDKIATIVTLRHFFIEWLMTPVGNLETAFIAYSLFENSISTSSGTMIDVPNVVAIGGGGGGISVAASTSESATKLVTKNLLQSGEKLVNASKIAYKNLIVLVDSLPEDIPARPLDKSEKRELMSKLVPWKRYILFERSNPLGLDRSQYFNRVSYSYRNCLLYFSYHPEVWYEYFIFIWNHHPVQLAGIDMATELLSSAIQRFLPKDEVLKLVLAEVYELRRKMDKVLHLYHSMVYIENSGEVVPNLDDSGGGGGGDVVMTVPPTIPVPVNKNNNDDDGDTSNTEGGVGATGSAVSVGNALVAGTGGVSTGNNNNAMGGLVKGEQKEQANSYKSGEKSSQEGVSAARRRGAGGDTFSASRMSMGIEECFGGATDGGGWRWPTSAMNKNFSQIITGGLATKQYNPGVSAVVIIEYLNFVLRSTNDKVVWRELFLDYIKRSPKVDDIKWVCYSQALNEWRLYNNLEGAYRIFYFGMYYRHLFLDVPFMSCFVSFLLDTGRLQQARSTLQSSIYEIYKETGKAPKQLWMQWFHLERMSGSSIYSLNYLNRIYQLQMEGRNMEIEMLLSKRQQQAWHAVLGAPEFAELNKEFIGADSVDPKTKVYGHSYIINPFDEESMISGGGGGADGQAGTSLNAQNQKPLHSANQSALDSNGPLHMTSGANRFILTCPGKFRVAFECFRFGSIYPNSSWTEFNMPDGSEYQGRGCCRCSSSSSSFHVDECNSCSKTPPEVGQGKTTAGAVPSSLGGCECSTAAAVALGGGPTSAQTGEEEGRRQQKLKLKQQQLGGGDYYYDDDDDANDDFESFLFERPLDFRLIRDRSTARSSKKRADGSGFGDRLGLMAATAAEEEEEACCDGSDLENIEGLDEDELEYYYYHLSNNTSDLAHVNEFKWSRVGRSVCSRPDTSSMVRFRFETYPIKNNSITGASTQLQSQILKSTLTDLNSGDVLRNIEDMQEFNPSLDSTNNKSFNTLLPKGIVDFAALLPPQSLPTKTLRSILGITQDVVDLLLTNLQTRPLPQKLDVYKYSPMTTSLANLSSNRNKNTENKPTNHREHDQDQINNDFTSSNSSRKPAGIGISNRSPTGFPPDNFPHIPSNHHLAYSPHNFHHPKFDLNTLQEMVQTPPSSMPWNNSDITTNTNILGGGGGPASIPMLAAGTTNTSSADMLASNNPATNAFFTPCNVPNPNRFSNKPKDPNSKVQIQL